MSAVVVGAGPAGLRCAEILAQAGRAVTVIGAEPGLPYNRVALSHYLVGDVADDDLITHGAGRLAALGITYRSGTRVTAIDRAGRTVALAGGETLPFTHLVLALGSTPFRLPLPGADAAHVLMYRTLDEVRAMIDTARRGGRAIVIGGGLLGLEAAVGLAKRGMAVTVVHAVDRLMERQLDPTAAMLLAERLAGQGIALELDAMSAAITAEGLVLRCGRLIPADLVVMAVGIRPQTALAREAGLAVGRAITVDDRMRTSDPAIQAVGECAEHDGVVCGLVGPCLAMAETAARHLLGEDVAYRPTPDATALKIAGAGVWSAGDIAANDTDSIVYVDREAAEYRRFLLRDDHLVGAVMYGETGDAAWYRTLLGRNVRHLRAVLPFGRAYAPALEAAE